MGRNSHGNTQQVGAWGHWRHLRTRHDFASGWPCNAHREGIARAARLQGNYVVSVSVYRCRRPPFGDKNLYAVALARNVPLDSFHLRKWMWCAPLKSQIIIFYRSQNNPSMVFHRCILRAGCRFQIHFRVRCFYNQLQRSACVGLGSRLFAGCSPYRIALIAGVCMARAAPMAMASTSCTPIRFDW